MSCILPSTEVLEKVLLNRGFIDGLGGWASLSNVLGALLVILMNLPEKHRAFIKSYTLTTESPNRARDGFTFDKSVAEVRNHPIPSLARAVWAFLRRNKSPVRELLEVGPLVVGKADFLDVHGLLFAVAELE